MGRNKNSGRKGGRLFPALCNILGIGILIFCIAVSLPLTLPRLLGYEAYNIVSGSMEPTISVGSIIYVKGIEAPDVRTGDIIAFYSGDSVICHRVTENRLVEGNLVTKGDANPREDLSDVPYRDLIGIVVQHFPYLGSFLTIFSTRVGKIYVLIFALCGIMFNILASNLRSRVNE